LKRFWEVIQLFQMSMAVHQRQFVRLSLHFKRILHDRIAAREAYCIRLPGENRGPECY
jgi:hypothetical protein